MAWILRLRTASGTVSLDETVYCGDAGPRFSSLLHQVSNHFHFVAGSILFANTSQRSVSLTAIMSSLLTPRGRSSNRALTTSSTNPVATSPASTYLLPIGISYPKNIPTRHLRNTLNAQPTTRLQKKISRPKPIDALATQPSIFTISDPWAGSRHSFSLSLLPFSFSGNCSLLGGSRNGLHSTTTIPTKSWDSTLEFTACSVVSHSCSL